ncbi:MAG: hypothetical protein KAI66_00110, partial [Lentisphaeria bacterium]|nr:hypothetical protein [Lentisphaeria bacterium]
WYCMIAETNRYGAGGQERGPGWTLIAISCLADALRTPRIMNAGNIVSNWIVNYQDPLRGVVSVPISEQPSYEGGSTFMHGIVGRGLGRWYDVTGDERTKQACIGISEWMTTEPMREMGRFWYKQSPRNSTRFGATSQCFTALTYAYALSGDAWFGRVALELYRLTGASTRSISWYPQGLTQLAPVIRPAEVRREQDLVGVAAGVPATFELIVRNTGDVPLKVSATVTCPPGFQRRSPKPMQVPVRGERVLAFVFSSKKKSATGKAQITLVLSPKGGKPVTRTYTVALKAFPTLAKLSLDLSQARIIAPMVRETVDGTQAAHTPRGDAFTGKPQPADGHSGGYAEWTVEIPHDGEYFLWTQVYWVDPKGNSLFARFDDGQEMIVGNDSNYRKWHWVQSGPVRLVKGKHRLVIRTREDGGRFQAAWLCDIPGLRP